MDRRITIDNREIVYKIKKSRRARNLRLTIYCDGGLVATLPSRLDESLVEKFIREKSIWILKKVDFFLSLGHNRNILFSESSRKEYEENKERALVFIQSRLEYFNQFYEYSWNKISVRSQKTRWGSCSKRGNLNFNYKIIFLPEKQADYIIVHELCHLHEFNHSKRFWNLVGKTIPNYREIVREIRGL